MAAAGRRNPDWERDEIVLGREGHGPFIAEPDVMHAIARSVRKFPADSEAAGLPREAGYEAESEPQGRYLPRRDRPGTAARPG
ncbi:MAG TPA: hypothetical protein VKV80_12665 [Streptosporangiaceae bacterium]|nr:hypothetical protein [Streptosporangiaceae bacterium]